MNEVKRLKRIVAVRTTQRDISAQKLMEAKGRLSHADGQFFAATQRLEAAQKKAVIGAELSPAELERMDVATTAAREDMAAWQEKKLEAYMEQEQARERVKAQHILLRQSELMGERAKKEEQTRQNTAQQQREDERAPRRGRV